MKKFVEGFMSMFGCFCGLIASVGGLWLVGDIVEKYAFYEKHHNEDTEEETEEE